MTKSILITQCLQNDFIQLLDKYDPLPNLLHVGYEESRRLLGEAIENSPLNRVIEWAYHTPEESLEIVHIRDWHNRNDEHQRSHLSQFGEHCIQDSRGADFVFSSHILPDRKHNIINATGLNDFVDTDIKNVLDPFSKYSKVRVGLMGVWTEAKITFLAYDLITRYPNFEIVVCSALTASSSRTMHFIALEQLTNILGVKVFQSIADFTNYLTGTQPKLTTKTNSRIDPSRLSFIPNTYNVSPLDSKVLQYLYRDAKEVEFSCLDGGFSGNVVLKAKSVDMYGHIQSPTVIKIGSRQLIAKERTSFERIQDVLGNNSPSVVDYVELEDRGAIKYRYAAMFGNDVKTFQKFYDIEDIEEIKRVLSIVFEKQLGRMYQASTSETLDLLKYYDFSSKYAGSIRRKVEELIGKPAEGTTLSLYGHSFPNVCTFYEVDLSMLAEKIPGTHYMSYIHGDLNGANIIIDAQGNVWLIDFFHTHKGHILKDLIKLENDILFIFMKIYSEKEFHEAVKLINVLLNVSDLGVPIDGASIEDFSYPQIQKAFQVVQYLRTLYPDLIHSDRSPYQYYTALMRYAMHTTTFEESNDYQKKLALYTGANCSAKIKEYLTASDTLRIDFMDLLFLKPSLKGKIGMTILPGRRDRDRDLDEDIKTILKDKISGVVCLLSMEELLFYGIKNLKESYEKFGLHTYFLPIVDQSIPTFKEAKEVVQWIHGFIEHGQNVLVHCVGGLGRTGTIAACYLKEYCDMNTDSAISYVRKFRSQRAIESERQKEFILEYTKE